MRVADTQPDQLRHVEKKQVLAVCTANVCRSPFVAALLQQRFRENGFGDVVSVESAGVRAESGREVDSTIVAMLAEMGVELAAKKAMPVVEETLRKADIILVMEEAHRQALFYRLPDALPKIFLLSELAHRYDEIPDPYGQGAHAYEVMAALVLELIEQGWPEVLKRLDVDSQ
jgi:protein-tyrosine-phosphatase